MPAATRSGEGRPAILSGAAAIVLGGCLAYAGSFSGAMLYDDFASIVENPALRHLWPWAGSAGAVAGGLTVSGRPVLQFSLAVNHALGGDQVWGYHAVNLSIHLLAGLVLFGLVRRTLARGGMAVDRAALLACAIALLWTVHPLQTESVTYIVQRAESLMGLLYLATLYGFVRGAEAGDGARSSFAALRAASADEKAARKTRCFWFGLSWLACLFGMATKEVMVTAPVLVLLYDRTFIAGTFAEAWRRRRGYYAGLAATWLVLAALVASTGGNRGGSAGFGVAINGWDYGLTQFEAVARYLRLALWPHPLVFEYGTFRAAGPGLLPCALLVLLLAAATLWGLTRPAAGHGGARAAGFLGAWFLVILMPTSLTPGMIQIIAEHRMYLSLAAVLAAGMLGADALAAKLGLAPSIRLAAFLAAALACGLLTFRRNAIYHSGVALWGDTVAKRPDGAVAVYNLGVALDQAGRLPEAAAQFVRAAQLRPDLAAPHYDLGFALYQMGRLEEAVAQYREALRIDPRSPLTRNSLGVALAALGRPLEAADQYAEALRLKPDYAQAQDNWGNALLQLGQVPEAAAHYGEAVRIDPDSAVAHYNLANALLRLGRRAEAEAQFALAQGAAKPLPSPSR